MQLFRKHPGKLIYLSEQQNSGANKQEVEEQDGSLREHNDAVDALPLDLTVTYFDLFFYVVSVVTYIFDVCSDFTVAYKHYADGRIWAGIAIALFSLVPSLILNLVTFMWMVDDRVIKRRFGGQGNTRTCNALLCLLQMGPLIYYYRAFVHARGVMTSTTEGQKRTHFKMLIEAERDATLLRFFEAFLESAPQLLLQSFLIASLQWQHEQVSPQWLRLQVFSVVASLVSLSWSVSIQHRSMRLSRADKANVLFHESIMQLVWRSLTLISRFCVLLTVCLHTPIWLAPLAAAHFALSVLHICALQSVGVGVGGGAAVELGLILINALIHTFAPFNMAEGQTRWRYAAAYAVEFIQCLTIHSWALLDASYNFPYKNVLALTSISAFAGGLSVMMIYYHAFHPTLRDARLIRVREEAVMLK